MARSTLNVLNSASVPLLTAQALGRFSDEKPDTQGFGSMLRTLTPQLEVRSGLTSQTVHLEALPGRIYGATDEAGSNNLTIIYAGAPADATEVLVTYSDGAAGQKGTPTLTFFAAVTGYQVEKAELPAAYDEVFDAVYV